MSVQTNPARAVLHRFVMPPLMRMVWAITVSWLLLHGSAATAEAQKLTSLRVSQDGHYLTDTEGAPFFWLADTAWDLFQRLEREEADRYLKDRADKGFTIIQAVIGGAGSHQGPNRYGDEPFLERDPTRPNERYFSHVDWVIERARHYGLRVALFPYWAGAFQSQSGVVGQPLNPAPVVLTVQTAEIYARWLGRRYREANISWVFGGDANPIWPRMFRFAPGPDGTYLLALEASDLTGQDWRPLYDAMAAGLSEGEGRKPFITYHPGCCTFPGMPQPLTSILFADRQWLTMNMIQSSHYENPPEKIHGGLIGFSSGWEGVRNYEIIAREYASVPTKPVIDGEPRYEDLGKDNDAANVAQKGYWTGYDARNAAYHAVFAGAAGHAYGNHAIWQFASPKVDRVDPPITPGLTWPEALQRPVSGQLRYLKELMLSRPYFTRIPDQSLVVGDSGRDAAHVGATRDADGAYAMVYIPHGQQVTIDLTRMAGPVIAWWFDPRTGTSKKLDGTFKNTAAVTFIPPSSGSEQDWVLVLDHIRKGFGAPGEKQDLSWVKRD